MKLPQAILFLLAFVTTIHALALPASLESIQDSAKELFKRKGGGGGGGRGGSSSSSSSSSSSGRTGSGSSSSSSGSSGRTSTTSNSGGATSRGSGPAPAYGGGRYYAGGSTTPYTSGQRRGSGAAPYLLGGAAIGGIGALGLYGAYVYAYPHYWYYTNRTSGQNETHPANCYCARYSVCGCDTDNNSTDYVNSVANNATVARVANNGTLYVNGTLPNGTTASGGTDDDTSAGFSLKQSLGYGPLLVGVGYAVWFM